MRVFFDTWLLVVMLGTLGVHWALPAALRPALLATVFVATVVALVPGFGVAMLLSALVVFGLARWSVADHPAGKPPPQRAGWVMIGAGLGVALPLLAVGKYGADFGAALWGETSWLAKIAVPLGISYFAFRLVAWALDVARGAARPDSLTELLAFLFFLPTFAAGPLETYDGLWRGRSPRWDAALAASGARRIAWGYAKKIVIVDGVFEHLLRVEDVVMATGLPSPSWIFVIRAFVFAYLDLSAYTDLAVGTSALFGFRVMENFNRPLWKRNPTEFWRGWHMSLSAWCNRNVYMPVFGASRNPTMALYATMMVMGLWHHVNLNWTAWALWHATGLTVSHRWLRYKRKQPELNARFNRYPAKLSGPIATFLFVALGYAFVATPDMATAWRTLSGCFSEPLDWLMFKLFT